MTQPLEHRGKGWAVKSGMLTAVGQHRLLCDADLHVPIEQVERLTALLESGTAHAVRLEAALWRPHNLSRTI